MSRNIVNINADIPSNVLAAAMSLFSGSEAVNVHGNIVIAKVAGELGVEFSPDTPYSYTIQEYESGADLTHLNIDPSVIYSLIISGILHNIDDGLLQDCRILKSLVISADVDSIGRYAFSGCVEVENLVIAGNILGIGLEAFAGIGMSMGTPGTLYLPESLDSIEERAFADANYNIYLHGKPSYVGTDAFMNVPHLYCDPELREIGAPWGAHEWN